MRHLGVQIGLSQLGVGSQLLLALRVVSGTRSFSMKTDAFTHSVRISQGNAVCQRQPALATSRRPLCRGRVRFSSKVQKAMDQIPRLVLITSWQPRSSQEGGIQLS